MQCQLWQNRNTIGGAGVRGCEAANYLHKVSVCEEQKLGGAKAPLAPPSPVSPPLCSVQQFTFFSSDIEGTKYTGW